jgi:hypothetical protein
MTFLGLLFVLGLAGLVVYAGIRLVPVYINYMKVASCMQQVAGEFKGGGADEISIRRALERRWGIEDIENPSFKDIEINRADGTISLHAAYSDVVPYLSNVSLSVSFDKTVTIE